MTKIANIKKQDAVKEWSTVDSTVGTVARPIGGGLADFIRRRSNNGVMGMRNSIRNEILNGTLPSQETKRAMIGGAICKEIAGTGAGTGVAARLGLGLNDGTGSSYGFGQRRRRR